MLVKKDNGKINREREWVYEIIKWEKKKKRVKRK